MAAAVQVAERAALEHAKRREMAARLEKQRVEMWLSRQGEWRARRVAQFRTDIAWSKEDRDAAMTAKMRWLARNNMFHGDRMARVTVSRENQLQVAGIIVLLNPGQPKWLPLSIAIHARDVTEAGLLD